MKTCAKAVASVTGAGAAATSGAVDGVSRCAGGEQHQPRGERRRQPGPHRPAQDRPRPVQRDPRRGPGIGPVDRSLRPGGQVGVERPRRGQRRGQLAARADDVERRRPLGVGPAGGIATVSGDDFGGSGVKGLAHSSLICGRSLASNRLNSLRARANNPSTALGVVSSVVATSAMLAPSP